MCALRAPLSAPRYPALFQVNTRVRLAELSAALGRTWRLNDRLGTAVYDRDGVDLATRGLYLDMPAWGYNVFAVARL